MILKLKVLHLENMKLVSPLNLNGFSIEPLLVNLRILKRLKNVQFSSKKDPYIILLKYVQLGTLKLS